MHDPIRVAVLGTGQMGSGIARLLLRKSGVALVGAWARRRERCGMDLGTAIGLERALGMTVSTSLSELIERMRPQVAIQATCSRLTEAWDEIATLVHSGVHVISIAEEMAYPAANSPALAEELQRMATAHGVAVLGTGINPGFVLDFLVIVLSGVCSEIRSITARRVNDLSPYGPTVLKAQGVGLSPHAFRQGLEDGSVVGHHGFAQSAHMIAYALGWHIDRFDEFREPIISGVERWTRFITVAPGQVAGCLHRAVAYVEGKPAITLVHPQQVRPGLEGIETGDAIEIAGTPNVRLAGSPEIPGGLATMALAINMIPQVLAAPPGLYCMADLPVPGARLGDLREFIRRPPCHH